MLTLERQANKAHDDYTDYVKDLRMEGSRLGAVRTAGQDEERWIEWIRKEVEAYRLAGYANGYITFRDMVKESLGAPASRSPIRKKPNTEGQQETDVENLKGTMKEWVIENLKVVARNRHATDGLREDILEG